MLDTTVVKESVTAGSMVNHLKERRFEYMFGALILHLLGVSDKIVAIIAGVCV